MIGFIKYKLLKWLWQDMCNKIDCEGCPMDRDSGFGRCDKCGDRAIDCYDIEDVIYRAARKAWRVE